MTVLSARISAAADVYEEMAMGERKVASGCTMDVRLLRSRLASIACQASSDRETEGCTWVRRWAIEVSIERWLKRMARHYAKENSDGCREVSALLDGPFGVKLRSYVRAAN